MGDVSSLSFGNHGSIRRVSAITARMTSSELVPNLTALMSEAGSRTIISRVLNTLEKDSFVPNSFVAQGIAGWVEA